MSQGLDFAGALVALHRFGLGARGLGAGDLRSAASDPRGFVRAELARPAVALMQGGGLQVLTTLMQALYVEQDQVKAAREALAASAQQGPPMAMADAGKAMPSGEMDKAAPANAQALKPAFKPTLEQDTFRSEALARFRRAAQADCGFVERLVAFWSNHFAVSVVKGGPVRLLVGDMERNAIRPHVFGRFNDMLIAVEQHPAMLFYLDNQQSIGPNSRAGQNGKRGLNENLAREIMELHTLGVGGGYTQADVTSFASVITGWTIAGRDGRLGAPGTFVFAANNHEPGSQIVMGRSYPESGVEQGEAALRDLARRPATATFIATKLARHFVSDTPPQSLVDKLAKVFTTTDGDLGAVSRALVDSDEAWKAPLTKIRTPYDYLVAATRLFGRIPEEPNTLLNGLNLLGQPLWGPPGPNGFSDVAGYWTAPEAMKLRLDIAAQLGQRLQNLPQNPSDLLEDAVGEAASPETRTTVARAESKAQGFALLLMAPEFQRR